MPDEMLAGQDAPAAGEAPNSVAAQNNAATTEGQTDGQSGEQESPAQEKTFTQKELDEILQKRLAKAERRARQQALQEYQALTQRPQQQQPAQAQGDDGKPAPREGETVAEYADRLTDWKLEQRDRKEAQKREQEQRQTTAQKIDRLYAEAEKLEGFDVEAYDSLPLTKPIVEALIESDVAPVLMKYMADNPDEVERISKLSERRQAVELGKLEAKLADSPPPKRVSSAPAPITPLRKPNTRPPITDTTDPRAAKELSTAEWIKAEEARMRRKYAGQA